MAHVVIPPLLRELTDGAESVDVAAGNLRELIARLDEQFPGAAGRLRSGERLAPGLAASVDGVLVTQGLLAQLRPESEVHFLPAIGGG